MFKKLGVVLLLVICLVGFCINPVSAKDDNFGWDDFGNVNINFHDKSCYAIHWVWFRISEKVSEDEYKTLYDLKWGLYDIRNTIGRENDDYKWFAASQLLNTRNKTYYANVGVSYYMDESHRKNSDYIKLDTNKFYIIKATFDTTSNHPKKNPKISLKVDEYDQEILPIYLR